VTNEGSGGFNVSGDGNTFEDVHVAKCTAILNRVNTGNQQTQQSVQQYGYFYAYQDIWCSGYPTTRVYGVSTTRVLGYARTPMALRTQEARKFSQQKNLKLFCSTENVALQAKRKLNAN
jgi:hypothetical protein